MSALSSPAIFLLGAVTALNTGKPGQPTEIAYGKQVDYAQTKRHYPFMARLVMDSDKCGGAVIAPRFIATAGHCLKSCRCFEPKIKNQDWSSCWRECFVKLREYNDFTPDQETVHNIARVHLPDKSGNPYESQGEETDFALIETENDVNTCTERLRECWPITPVRLPGPNMQHIPNLEEVRTLGWGATEFTYDAQSEFLAQLDITINTINTSANGSYHYLIETNVGHNGADPCHGDSGGPLLLRDKENKWTLVATLLGGGYSCDHPSGQDKTSDWNSVNVHLPWIKSIIGEKQTTRITTTTRTTQTTTKRRRTKKKTNIETATENTCPTGWSREGEKCFKLLSSQYTWSEANKSCGTLVPGGTLATVENRREKKKIDEILKRIKIQVPGWNGVWLGGQKVGGKWRWLNNKEMSFTLWYEGQPHEGGDCLAMFVSNSAWFNTNCDDTRYTVCMVMSS